MSDDGIAAHGSGTPECPLTPKAPPSGKALAALALQSARAWCTGTSGPVRCTRIKECFTGHHSIRRHAGERARRPLAHLLVAQLHRLLQVPRRSSCGPTTGARAGSSPCSRWLRPSGIRPRAGTAAGRRGPVRCRAALRRWRHHARDLGARRRSRGLAVAAPALIAVGLADGRGDHHSRSSPSRSGARRGSARVFGPVMASGSSASRSSGSAASCMAPEVCKALNPWYAVDFFLRRRAAGVPHPGVGRAGRHRRARRCTRTWGTSAGGRSGWPGSRVVLPCLLSTTSDRRRLPAGTIPRRRSQSVLLPGAGLGALPDGGDRHGGGHRRLAGAHLGRVLPHPPGGAAGLHPAGDGSSTPPAPRSGQIYIPEVNTALWLGCLALVVGFRQLEQPGGGLRYRRHRHDADHHAAACTRWPATGGTGPCGAPGR